MTPRGRRVRPRPPGAPEIDTPGGVRRASARMTGGFGRALTGNLGASRGRLKFRGAPRSAPLFPPAFQIIDLCALPFHKPLLGEAFHPFCFFPNIEHQGLGAHVFESVVIWANFIDLRKVRSREKLQVSINLWKTRRNERGKRGKGERV